MTEEKRFLRKTTPRRPAAIILGGESSHGLAFARSLGRKGIPVLSVGTSWRPPMRTRFAYTIVQPCRDGDEAVLMERLRELGKQLPVKAVVIPCGDDYVLFLSRCRTELAPYYEFVIPDEDTVETLVSKKSQYRHVENSGVPIPKTFVLPEDPGQLADEIPYPCILKPAYMHLWTAYQNRIGITRPVKVLVAGNLEEFANHIPLITDSGLEWIAQEQVEGGDDQLYSLYAYFSRDSKLLAAFVRRKLRQSPPDFGAGCYSIGVREDEIVDLGIKLLQPIRYRGLTNIEFKRDTKDGRFKLIEINVRSAAQASLPIDSGVDLPYIAYQDALNEKVEPLLDYRLNVKWINLAVDFLGFLEYRRRGQLGVRQWVASLIGVRSYAYFAWDDPVPAVSFGLMAIRKLISGAVSQRKLPRQ